jgi:predicted dehydrogenase
MMRPRVGIIGAGIYGTTVIKAYAAAHRMGQIELVALADIKETLVQEKAKEFKIKGYLDYKEMIQKEKLDAVSVVTPDFLHREIALEVASHGIHLLMEKPLDTSVKGAQEMVQAAKENNVLLFVDFHKRFDPAHINLKKQIQEGKLGKVQYGYIWVENKTEVPSVWFKSWAKYSSPAWFIGIHFFDLLYWLLESKPKKVYATGIKDKLINMGIDTYDSLQAKIEFENGVSFTVDSSWILPNSFPSAVNQGIRVIGSNGIWEVDSQDRGVFYSIEEDQRSNIPNYYGMLETEHPIYGKVPKGYMIESIQYFLQLVARLKEGATIQDFSGLYPSGEEAIVSTMICEAVHKSAEIEKIIDLDLD